MQRKSAMIYHLNHAFCFAIYSLLYIETADRPGLLVEIIKIIADINIDVESAEIDTQVCTRSHSLIHTDKLCYDQVLISHLTGTGSQR